MIYDELTAGSVKFIVAEDGTEQIERHPPTSKDLRAARALKSLVDQLNGLTQANQQLQSTNDSLFQELNLLRQQNEKCSVVSEPVVS